MRGAIGAQGRQVMEAMEAGRSFRRGESGWKAGALAAPDSLVGDLARRDLVRVVDGRLELTAVGRGWSARAARPDMPNRLLAERALPQDGEGRAPEMEGKPRRARSVTVNLAESPLGWLVARGLVSTRQFDAGERLRHDWEMAGLAPRVTMRWDEAPPSSGRRGPGAAIDPGLAQIAAKRRFEAAVTAIGAGMNDVAWRVICGGEGLEAAEQALGWPRRAGKLVLLMALDRLADHYGLALGEPRLEPPAKTRIGG